jgi:hypothetical protein
MGRLFSLGDLHLTMGEQDVLEHLEEAAEHARAFDHLQARHFRRLLDAGYVTTDAPELDTARYGITASGHFALVRARRRWPTPTHPLAGL